MWNFTFSALVVHHINPFEPFKEYLCRKSSRVLYMFISVTGKTFMKSTTNQEYLQPQRTAEIDAEIVFSWRAPINSKSSHTKLRYYRSYALRLKIMSHVFKPKHLRKPIWEQYSKLYSSVDGEKRVRNRCLPWSIVQDWNFVDTKRLSLTRFWEMNIQTLHDFLYYNVKTNLKQVKKENEEKMESEFRKQHTVCNFKFWYS